MKIIFLNTWNGKIRDKISDFIKDQAKDADIFCFQEAYDCMRDLTRELLPDYDEQAAYKFVIEDDDFPQATYTRKNMSIISSGSILKDQKGTGLGIFQELQLGEKRYSSPIFMEFQNRETSSTIQKGYCNQKASSNFGKTSQG